MQEAIRPAMQTMTYKGILKHAYDKTWDFDEEMKRGVLNYMRSHHVSAADFGRGSGKTTAAVEFTRDNLGVVLVMHTDREVERVKRQYRIGNVVSRRQLREGRFSRNTPVRLFIFDECRPDALVPGARYVLLGGLA